MGVLATCRDTERSVYPREWQRLPKVRSEANYRSFAPLPLSDQYEPKKSATVIISFGKVPFNIEEIKFRRLADEWERETAMHSVTSKIVLHPAYQRIIGMGPTVIPLILRQMKKKPGHWFWALDALTGGESPAEGAANLLEATSSWIKWGESKGYLEKQ